MKNKATLLYIVGLGVGMACIAGNLYQMLLVSMAGGLIAGYLISKISKEAK